MAAPPAHRASPPVLPGELVEEILLRLPPDDPACLLRSSLVCKTWGSAVSHPSFRRRIHELHRTPPVLGFLHNGKEGMSNFISTTALAFSLAAPDRRFWRALDCRHGRVLLWEPITGRNTKELLVWEPVTGAQQRVPVPVEDRCSGAAVFCAADGCDHYDCLGSPFCVVFVICVEDEEYVTSACLYSSETSTWGELTSMHGEDDMDFTDYSSVLVGRSLLYFMSDVGLILEYDLARNELTVIDTPDPESNYLLMLAEDGGLRLTEKLDSHLKLWSREESDRTDARWVLSRIIDLRNLLPADALVNAEMSLTVLGFAERANVIFVDTADGLFTIELVSERVRKVYGNNDFHQLFPVVGFYTPVSRNEHQDLPLSNASVEERGEEEITVDQAQQLFDNGPKPIKEGTSSTHSNVSAMSSSLHDRVPSCGDVALESTDTDAALLYNAQEGTDPLAMLVMLHLQRKARSDLKMEFFHLISFLLSYFINKRRVPNDQVGLLLLVSIPLLCYFSLFHAGNQAVLR
ncbi:unnamed protein product [Alopecurus aequalis]